MERAAAAGIEAGMMVGGAADHVARQIRRARVLQRRQVVEVIVDRRQIPGGRILDYPVHPPFRLAGEQRDAEIQGVLQIGLHVRQHGEAAGDVKSADYHLNAGRAQRAGDVERAGKLVGLHADQPDHAEPGIVLDLLDHPLDRHARVGLVEGGNLDVDVRPQYLPFGGFGGERIDHGQRVGWDRGAHPLHHIAVVVVVRRLDQEHQESAFGLDDRSQCKSPKWLRRN